MFMGFYHIMRSDNINLFQCKISFKPDIREAYAYFFPQQKCELVTGARMHKSTLLLRKSCRVGYTRQRFEIVAYRNVDKWTRSLA